MEPKIDPEMDPEIVVEIEPEIDPEIVREIVLEMERALDHPEIVLEIVREMEAEIESAPQNPINEPPEIDQQQQTNNSIIPATTPLTNNDSKVDSADQKNSSGSRKCYLLLILFVIYYYLYDSPTLEECDRTFELDENFDFYQCKCFQDLRICKISLVILQTCNTTSPAKVFRNKTNCGMMYSECSTADKYSCKAGMCECLKTMVTCFSHHKCNPIPTKKARSIGVVAVFTEIILGDLGEYSMWN